MLSCPPEVHDLVNVEDVLLGSSEYSVRVMGVGKLSIAL